MSRRDYWIRRRNFCAVPGMNVTRSAKTAAICLIRVLIVVVILILSDFSR